ncbi:hypothetical protein [Acidovorax sp. BLS4]|uniref:helix-turn-helix transcriptional regulator n=1 Tax=Acidovorax sp. BLS4 TaxID=3273430 RepID=UPI002941C12F|nr:hypothetical protein [Paracidovorax avenae]WOI43754.1 hypothetical protein R1Z03_14535 [Paracidovorax avenae]
MTATEAQLVDQVNKLTKAVQYMASMLGTRLDRGQLAERMGVHRNTLAKRLATDKSFPRPGKDGKWLLSEVIDWEQRQ